MKQNKEALLPALASTIVIFVAMMSPVVALLIAFFALLYLALKNLENAKGIIKTVSLAFIVAASFSFAWAALHDIVRGQEQNYTLEYLGLLAVGAVLIKTLLIISKRQRR